MCSVLKFVGKLDQGQPQVAAVPQRGRVLRIDVVGGAELGIAARGRCAWSPPEHAVSDRATASTASQRR